MPLLDPREGAEFFLNVPAKLDNPYADFAYFREHKPVFYYASMDAWFVFSYDDVEACFKDPRLSSKRTTAWFQGAPADLQADIAPFVPVFDKFVLMRDGEDHAQLRRLMHTAFSPRVVANLQHIIEQATKELLDHAQAQGAMDAAADFAHILPVIVISDMLGVAQENRLRIRRWADDLADFFNVIPITRETTLRFKVSAEEMIAHLRNLMAERRARPKDDFLTELLHAKEEGKGLDDEDIIANAIILLIAGHETTRNLIGNALYLLLTHPAQLAQVKADASRFKSAVDEALRFESVHPMMPRLAAEDLTVRGGQIRKGQFVFLYLSSANRDPAHFPDPDEFDITRHSGKHMAFGMGAHYCLGAPLARLEGQIALQTMFARMPALRLDPDKPIVWQRIANLRGPRSLPVRF